MFTEIMVENNLSLLIHIWTFSIFPSHHFTGNKTYRNCNNTKLFITTKTFYVSRTNIFYNIQLIFSQTDKTVQTNFCIKWHFENCLWPKMIGTFIILSYNLKGCQRALLNGVNYKAKCCLWVTWFSQNQYKGFYLHSFYIIR